MGAQCTSNWLPLSVAAQRLKLTRARAYAACLTGRVEAKLERGRWFVLEESVKRLQQAAEAERSEGVSHATA